MKVCLCNIKLQFYQYIQNQSFHALKKYIVSEEMYEEDVP